MSRKPESLSRVTNGTALFLEEVDGRTVWPRRFRDLIDLHVADLGGEGEISEAERQLVRRCATLGVELERLEAEFAVEGQADPEKLDLYIRASGALKRLWDALGLERRQKRVPTLHEVLDRVGRGDADGGVS